VRVCMRARESVRACVRACEGERACVRARESVGGACAQRQPTCLSARRCACAHARHARRLGAQALAVVAEEGETHIETLTLTPPHPHPYRGCPRGRTA
jgi:hypothetical protein